MNREQHVKLADDAITHAEPLAGWAETAARESKPDAEPLAAAGALWDSIARTHLLIAAATPTADANTPEA
ncbi:hypothetical protein [Streptomyces sp. NPDC059271]|uniref:hypothetical protein n=1 Tax=Streptomyces sp. NPDC059271 TaxID=3346799 RepID=UPI0036A19462